MGLLALLELWDRSMETVHETEDLLNRAQDQAASDRAALAAAIVARVGLTKEPLHNDARNRYVLAGRVFDVDAAYGSWTVVERHAEALED